jgi:predicted AAA+ superfamily ATPase
MRQTSLKFVRPLYHTVHWENSLNALLGARGVGKTTLLLQRLKTLNLGPEEALYIDLGDIYFQENRLLDFAMEFVSHGGRYLLIDEVHRYGYGTWAQELKQVYDLYRSRLKVTFTGSSAIRILKQKADLSRRALQVRVPGLSFREYLYLKEGLNFPVLSYQEILTRSGEITRELLNENEFTPLFHLQQYWQTGYYPFFLDSPDGYLGRLNTIVQLVLESDIPSVMTSGRTDYQKISRLLYAIASSAPFKPNVTKLAERVQLSRDSLYQYLELLDRANLILSLRNEAKGVAVLAKPDKIYLDNPNLVYTLAPNQSELGTIRETFFLNQLKTLTYEAHILPPEIKLPKKGDFVLLDKDDRYLFEVGGPNKTIRQIGMSANHFVVVDSESSGSPHKIPLWLFGLLY